MGALLVWAERRGELAHLQVTLTTHPYEDAAIAVVPRLRAAAPNALVGGPTAEEADTHSTPSSSRSRRR